jgi:hypothetical protein
VMYFRRNGTLPGSRIPQNANQIDPDAEAFSTAPNDDEYAPVGMHDQDPKEDHHTYNPYAADDHSNLDTSHVDRYDTSYGGSTVGAPSTYGGSGVGNAGSSYGNVPDNGGVSSPLGMNPSSSYTGGPGTGRAHFPVGNYDRDL